MHGPPPRKRPRVDPPMQVIPAVVWWLHGPDGFVDGFDQMPWGPITCPCAMAAFLEQKELAERELALRYQFEQGNFDDHQSIFEQQFERLEIVEEIARDLYYGDWRFVRVPDPLPCKRRPPLPPVRPRDGVLEHRQLRCASSTLGLGLLFVDF